MMVKGISKQVIVVDSPDRRYFDQAIFILRSDTAAHTSQNQGFLLKGTKNDQSTFPKRYHLNI